MCLLFVEKIENSTALFGMLKRYVSSVRVSINRFPNESKAQSKADAIAPKMMNKGHWFLFMNIVFFCTHTLREEPQLCSECWKSSVNTNIDSVR